MELPNLARWSAGDQHDEDMFNDVSYALNFLLNPPECRVEQTTAQSIATGVATATSITFQNVNIDNDGMWNAGTPSLITIQTSGWYEIEFAVSWATKSSDATVRFSGLVVNGANAAASIVAWTEFMNDSSPTPDMVTTYDYFFSTGDTVALGAMQNTGANLNTGSTSPVTKDQQTYLRVRWASL